ncbi:MAG: TIR domain-containing protein [Proteobacteria bacterium]|nr:TIR domain-containing protein [Burkholderiales bacterium]
MADVFISYARADGAFVRELHESLAAAQHETWVDWQGIPPTAEWLAEIYRAIDAANASIFVISPAWVASRVCRLELDHAAAQGKRLIPVVCADAPDSSVPEALARLNWVLMRPTDDFAEALRRLITGLDTDLDWARAHTRLIVRAAEWTARRRDDSGLLRGADLTDAERWLGEAAAHTEPTPTPLQAEYIRHSRQSATRRQRSLLGAVAGAFVIAVGLAIWAVVERGTAQMNERAAKEQEGFAVKQRGIAEQRTVEARAAQVAETEQRLAAETAQAAETQQRLAAETARSAETQQRLAAEAAEREAVAQRDEAVRQRRAAQARQLAARAEFLQGSDPGLAQKAVLLAAESMNLLPNVEADQVLRRALRVMAPRIGALTHGGIVEPLATQGEGAWLAIGDRLGVLRRFNLAEMRVETSYELGRRIEQVAVAPVGRIVAAGVRREGLRIVDERPEGPAQQITDDSCDVHALRFSSTASHLAVACPRGVVLWNTAGWGEPLRLRIPNDAVAVAFDPDGTRLVALDSEGDLRVWNLQGKALAHVVGQESGAASRWSRCCVGFLAFSSDGRYLAATNLEQRDIRLFNTADWKLHARLDHESPVHALSFDRSIERLATGTVNGRVRVWDVTSARVMWIADHAAEVTHLRLDMRPSTADTATLVSTSTDRTVRVWDPWTGVERMRASHVGPVVWADIVAGRLVTAEQSMHVGFWRTESQSVPLQLSRFKDSLPPLDTCVDANSNTMAVAFTANAVTIDAKSVRQQQEIFYRTSSPRGVAFAPGCRWLALGDGNGLQIHSTIRGQKTFEEKGFFAGASMAFSGTARWLTLNHRDRDSQLRRSADWQIVGFGAACARPRDLVVSRDERSVALRCGEDLVVFDIDSGRESARRPAKQTQFRFVPGSGDLVVVSAGRLQLLSMPGLAERATVVLPSGDPGQLAISPRGGHVALAGWKQQTVWTLPSLQRVGELDEAVAGGPDEIRLSFTPDDRSMIVRGNQRLRVVQLQPWRPTQTFEHLGDVIAVATDPAQRQLAAVIAWRPPEREIRHAVQVWPLGGESHAETVRFDLQRESRTLQFSPDGRFLLADNLYALQPAELVTAACRLVSRNLTTREWTRELGEIPYRLTCPGLPKPDDKTPDWER